MAFNTAIFWDIENLLKGYSFTPKMIQNLSLADTLETLRQTGRLGEVALQRAYANWSDPRLGALRDQINDLGMDPIQVFGFSRDPKKNAADIQLAIDTIDLAHVRPGLQVFVIVSGDGGFAALAKKLHEYGKVVIGCAYRSAANRVLRAVCDEFVWLVDPEEDDEVEQEPSPVGEIAAKDAAISDSRVRRMALHMAPIATSTPESVIIKTHEILEWFASDSGCHVDLERTGIHLPVVREAIKYAIPDFQPAMFGMDKFVDYMRLACQDTALCLAQPAQSTQVATVLVLRSAVPARYRVLPDPESRAPQSPESRSWTRRFDRGASLTLHMPS